MANVNICDHCGIAIKNDFYKGYMAIVSRNSDVRLDLCDNCASMLVEQFKCVKDETDKAVTVISRRSSEMPW